MKIRKQIFGKIIAGIVLLLLAAMATLVLKSILMARNPEYALPIVRVECNGEGLPAENQMLESYSWQFLTIVKTGQLHAADAWQNIPAAWEPPNAPLSVGFSFPASSLKISRTDVDGFTFNEVGGELRTPHIPGEYTYRIEASWGTNKSLLYYFKVRIPE
ncbi:hypothetical protein LJC61_09490 [Ruminococcaceae bacterium OttesenSCG-928-A16]|nr:hypothetical protein [Ruminococcaceae bacterium OttesenSCG-928-A16]